MAAPPGPGRLVIDLFGGASLRYGPPRQHDPVTGSLPRLLVARRAENAEITVGIAYALAMHLMPDVSPVSLDEFAAWIVIPPPALRIAVDVLGCDASALASTFRCPPKVAAARLRNISPPDRSGAFLRLDAS